MSETPRPTSEEAASDSLELMNVLPDARLKKGLQARRNELQDQIESLSEIAGDYQYVDHITNEPAVYPDLKEANYTDLVEQPAPTYLDGMRELQTSLADDRYKKISHLSAIQEALKKFGNDDEPEASNLDDKPASNTASSDIPSPETDKNHPQVDDERKEMGLYARAMAGEFGSSYVNHASEKKEPEEKAATNEKLDEPFKVGQEVKVLAVQYEKEGHPLEIENEWKIESIAEDGTYNLIYEGDSTPDGITAFHRWTGVSLEDLKKWQEMKGQMPFLGDAPTSDVEEITDGLENDEKTPDESDGQKLADEVLASTPEDQKLNEPVVTKFRVQADPRPLQDPNSFRGPTSEDILVGREHAVALGGKGVAHESNSNSNESEQLSFLKKLVLDLKEGGPRHIWNSFFYEWDKAREKRNTARENKLLRRNKRRQLQEEAGFTNNAVISSEPASSTNRIKSVQEYYDIPDELKLRNMWIGRALRKKFSRRDTTPKNNDTENGEKAA